MSNRFITPSGDSRIDALLEGIKWGSGAAGSGTTLTYSFPTTGASWAYGTPTEQNAGWWGLNTTQQVAFRAALSVWSDVAGINFVESVDGASYGDIRVAYSNAVGGNTAAYAYTPGNGSYSGNFLTPNAQAGDVWINPSQTSLGVGTQGFATLVHELGHALGLKHTFESDGQFPAIDPAFDSSKYSVMSYTDYDGAGYIYTDIGGNRYSIEKVTPTTPMLYDILAIQHLYGANMNHAVGDTTYTFGADAELKTIWDGGGADTFDLSNQQVGVVVNLNDGEFSSIGLRQMSYNGVKTLADENIAIAFGADIENAIGSAYADQITGNELNNQLRGGLGDDVLNGGAGTDIALFSGAHSSYQFSEQGNVITASGLDGSDQLISIEQLQFDDGLFAINDLLNGTTPAVVPTQKSEVDFTPGEGSTAYFLLELSGPLSGLASVNYSTRDGSAVAGQDYIATSGTASLQAGETHIAIAVELMDDAIAEGNETFSLVVTDPVGGSFPGGQIELVAQRTIIDNDSIA